MSASDRGLTWGGEPPDVRPSLRRSVHRTFATQLRERPGEWARLPAYNTRSTARSVASQIRNGQLAYDPPGAFDARTDDSTQETARVVWIRFVGESTP